MGGDIQLGWDERSRCTEPIEQGHRGTGANQAAADADDSFEFVGSAASRIQQVGNAIPPMLARSVGEHIAREYGFTAKYGGNGHPSLRFCLTRSEGMSPALAQTESLLAELVSEKDEQLVLLEQARK